MGTQRTGICLPKGRRPAGYRATRNGHSYFAFIEADIEFLLSRAEG